MSDKIKLCIFDEFKENKAYGIKTYINQLIECLLDSEYELIVVNLCTSGEKVCDCFEGKLRQIFIPYTPGFLQSMKTFRYYLRNTAFILKELLGETSTRYIFHLNYMSSYWLVVYLKKLFECQVVLTIHYKNWNIDLKGDERRLITILKKPISELNKFESSIINELNRDYQIISHCDYIICVANHTLNTYNRLNSKLTKNMSVIHNAIKDEYRPVSIPEKARIRKRFGLPVNATLFIYAGRLEELKGIAQLIEAFKLHLEETHSNSHLALVGSGDLEKFKRMTYPWQAHISFLDWRDKDSMYQLYSTADIGIISSLYEEFGFTAIEMMMHRLPIISSDTGGLSEIIMDGITGYTVPLIYEIDRAPHLDIIALKEKINHLSTTTNLIEQMRNKSRQIFLQKFEITSFRDKLSKIYNNLSY